MTKDDGKRPYSLEHGMMLRIRVCSFAPKEARLTTSFDDVSFCLNHVGLRMGFNDTFFTPLDLIYGITECAYIVVDVFPG